MTRPVDSVITAQRQMEGGGFPVRRPFPTATLDRIDPFLLLDEMGPVEWAPGEAIGAPDHPHRGFETVTYLLAGHMCHRDSWGNVGELRAGDVQWRLPGLGWCIPRCHTPISPRAAGRFTASSSGSTCRALAR
jgi:redox-sensitive bicupin YhaK (pirin superfamily)